MLKKIKPGDTFDHVLDGVTYKIEVLSLDDEIDTRQQAVELERRAKQESDVTLYYQAWKTIIGKHIKGWSRTEPVQQITSLIDRDTAGDLAAAVMNGNVLSEDEAKN